MILLRVDDKIQFTPENDVDCFNLGGLANKISCSVNFDRDSAKPLSLSNIAIKESDLLAYLFK